MCRAATLPEMGMHERQGAKYQITSRGTREAWGEKGLGLATLQQANPKSV